MNYIPEDPNIYDNNQIIINSDRLIFNAKKDSILLSSNKAIGFNTDGNFHFDGNGKFIVNADKIILGIKNTADGAIIYGQEPAILGNELEFFVSRLLDTLLGLVTQIECNISYIDSSGNPTGYNPENETALETCRKELNDLRLEFVECKSKTVILK